MSERLFKVDLSDGARDFQPTATEPGLAMLDRNNANYTILRRWLGDYVAEPEWKGQDVHFFVRDEARGRLEDVHCVPCTKADLLGPLLKESLEEIDQKLRKSRPETANEQLLHRIIRKKFADLTRDYDASDFHCYFFKYRQKTEPWKLVWCWGYQRTDVEPAQTLVCINKECEALYEKRPKQRARCPVCATVGSRGRKPPTPLWVRLSSLALLLLLLLCGIAFFALNRPKLVATPDDWGGPPGSRVKYKIEHKAWYFWNSDVTDKVVPQSHDKRIVRFDPSGALAKARSPGQTFVTFRFKNLSVDSTVRVGQPKQPKSIALQPTGDITLAVDGTKQLSLIGTYDPKEKLDPVDLTELAEWTVEKPTVLAAVSPGRLQGLTEGLSKVTARYRANEKEKWLEQSRQATVMNVDYKSIELAVEPKSFGLGSGGRIDVLGVDAEGKKYSLLGSSLLKLAIEPADNADIDGDYIVGIKKGTAKLNATLHKLAATTTFEVTDSLLTAGTFSVYPDGDVKMYVGETLSLDISTASEAKIESKSSKVTVVDVVPGDDLRKVSLVGRSPGTADVVLKQGTESVTLRVTVMSSGIVSLHVDPPIVILGSGQARTIRVYGRNEAGDQIDVAPDQINWVKQPPSEYAELNRKTLEMFGVTPSASDWPLVAQLANNDKLRAESAVRIVSSPSATLVDIGGDEFLVHPPVSIVGGRVVPLNTGAYLGGDLVYSDGRVIVGDIAPDSVLGRSGLKSGTVITGIGDYSFDGRSLDDIRRYFSSNQVMPGGIVRYSVDGGGGVIKLGETGILVQEVRLVSFSPENLTKTDFNASLTLELREAADYRVTNAAGDALNDWQPLGPSAVVSLSTSKIPRTTSDEYELFIERRIGDNIRRYQLPFRLTTTTP